MLPGKDQEVLRIRIVVVLLSWMLMLLQHCTRKGLRQQMIFLSSLGFRIMRVR
nr:hypothetical protein Iba_chr02aCG11350 [Ipomoea batatas]